jgi:hypothetical protein
MSAAGLDAGASRVRHMARKASEMREHRMRSLAVATPPP